MNIPVYQQQVQEQVSPDARYVGASSDASFGGTQAKQLGELAKGISDTGTALLSMERKTDKIKATEAYNQSLIDYNKWLYGDGTPENKGALMRTGNEALTVNDEYAKFKDETKKKYLSTLTNEYAKELFSASYDDHAVTVGGEVNKFHAQQVDNAYKNSLDGNSYLAFNNAINGRNNYDIIDKNWVDIKANTLERWKGSGFEQAKVLEAKNNFFDGLAKTFDNDGENALKQFLAYYKNDMGGEIYSKYNEKLKEKADQNNRQLVAVQYLDANKFFMDNVGLYKTGNEKLDKQIEASVTKMSNLAYSKDSKGNFNLSPAEMSQANYLKENVNYFSTLGKVKSMKENQNNAGFLELGKEVQNKEKFMKDNKLTEAQWTTIAGQFKSNASNLETVTQLDEKIAGLGLVKVNGEVRASSQVKLKDIFNVIDWADDQLKTGMLSLSDYKKIIKAKSAYYSLAKEQSLYDKQGIFKNKGTIGTNFINQVEEDVKGINLSGEELDSTKFELVHAYNDIIKNAGIDPNSTNLKDISTAMDLIQKNKPNVYAYIYSTDVANVDTEEKRRSFIANARQKNLQDNVFQVATMNTDTKVKEQNTTIINNIFSDMRR